MWSTLALPISLTKSLGLNLSCLYSFLIHEIDCSNPSFSKIENAGAMSERAESRDVITNCRPDLESGMNADDVGERNDTIEAFLWI